MFHNNLLISDLDNVVNNYGRSTWPLITALPLAPHLLPSSSLRRTLVQQKKKKMESEDDMHDANDEESLEDFYSGETAADSDDLDAADYEFIDNDSDDSDDLTSHRHQVSFSI